MIAATPSYAQQQSPIKFGGQIVPKCSFSMLNNIPIDINSNVAESIDNSGSKTDPILVNNNQPPSSPTLIGDEKLLYESLVAINNQQIVRFGLTGNHGSLTTICNTTSTLSVTVDQTQSRTNNLKIRFTGGTGIYQEAGQDRTYRATAIFNSQGVTRSIGDTALVEVDLPTGTPESIFVNASLTAQ